MHSISSYHSSQHLYIREDAMPERSERKISRRERQAAARKKRILDAAARVFARRGYQRATTKEIADEADVGEGTIYSYFGSKRDLLLALVSSMSEPLLTPPEGVPTDDFEALIAAFLRDRLTLTEQSLDLTRVLLYEARFDDDLRREYMENVLRKLATRLEERMTPLIEVGSLRPIHTGVATLAIMGSFLGFVLLERELQMELPPFDEIVADMTSLFLDGLRARDEAEGGRDAN
jgi:AcrR family transcriptional regulator